MRSKLVFLAIFLFIYIGFASAALGITPAKREYTFTPNGEFEIQFEVISDNPNKQIDLYAQGDFAQYATLDKTRITGPGAFTVKVKLPPTTESYGKNYLYIGAKEVPEEDRFISVAIDIKALVIINVPYPGKYIETSLSVGEGNQKDSLPVELLVKNRGTDDINANVHVNFYDSSGSLVYEMPFSPTLIKSGEDRPFRKMLDTTDFQPGVYLAEGVVDYGEIYRINSTFRIGSLFLSVLNFTEKIPYGGIEPFEIYAKSEWNSPLSGVFADVDLSGEGGTASFRTPAVDFAPWETKLISGFLETGKLAEGVYNANIVVHYGTGETRKEGNVVLYSSSYALWIALSVGALVLILAILVFIILRRRKGKKKRR